MSQADDPHSTIASEPPAGAATSSKTKQGSVRSKAARPECALPGSDEALTSEGLRSLLYEIAAEAHLARLAMRSYEEDLEIDNQENETLLAIERFLLRTKERLEQVAGGYTFDRLSNLEGRP